MITGNKRFFEVFWTFKASAGMYNQNPVFYSDVK